MSAPVRASALLGARHDGCTGLVDFRAFPSKSQQFIALDDFAGMAAFVRAHRDENVFNGIATRKSDESGALPNCAGLPTLFYDIDFKDTPEIEARARLANAPLTPSAVVHSGGGLHVHHFLKECVDLSREAAEAGKMLRRLASYYCADLKSAEPARVLRVVGTLNFKYDPARLVTVEEFHPEHRYNLADFEEWLPAAPDVVVAAPVSLQEPLTEGQRNAALYKLGRGLKAKGLPAGVIASTLHSVNAEQGRPPLPGQELEALIAQVLRQPDRAGFEPTGDTVGESPIVQTLSTVTARGRVVDLAAAVPARQAHPHLWRTRRRQVHHDARRDRQDHAGGGVARRWRGSAGGSPLAFC